MFFVNSHTRLSQITDGASHTALMSESILGQVKNGPVTQDPQVDYKFLFCNVALPLSDARCNSAALWNESDGRGFSWASGEYRCALYNHYYLPNQAIADCIAAKTDGGVQLQFTPFGWRAGAAGHLGGVNLLLADASVQWIDNAIDLTVWQAWSTRRGGETPTQAP